MSEAPAVAIRPMEDGDVDAVVALLTRALGAGPGGADRAELFAWKHLRNPFGRSVALLAEDGDALVGVRTFMRWRFAAPGAGEVQAVRAVDTATAPEVQRRGVFSALTRAGLERCREEGVGFVFNTPNSKSLPGYLKMGWREVARWPMWLRVRRPVRLAGAAVRRNMSSGGPVAAGSDRLRTAGEALGRTSLAPVLATATSGLGTVRSAAFLRWRYAEGPLPYHGLFVDDPPALVIARIRSRGSLTEAVVCEALGDTAALGGLLRELPRAVRADHAVAHFGPGTTAREALRSAGYRRLPRAGMTFVVRPVEGVEPPAGLPDPLREGSWSLSLGDLELF